MTSSTADLYDEDGENLQVCETQFRQYGGRHAFEGLITTVRCFQDNALLKSILGTPGDGGVFVIDGGGSLHAALTGDLTAQLGVDNKWAGLIINGAVRDSDLLAKMDIGVKALGSVPVRAGRLAPVNVTSTSPSAAPPSAREITSGPTTTRCHPSGSFLDKVIMVGCSIPAWGV